MNRIKGVLMIALVGSLIMSACQGEPAPTLVPTATVAPTATATETPTEIPIPEPVVEVVKGVPYVEGGDTRQSSDIYFVPGRETPYPTLLVLLTSLPAAMASPQARELAAQGYAVVVSDQRSPGEGNYRPRIEDSFCALGWLYAQAETYNFDLDRVFVMAYGVNGVIAVRLGLGDATAYDGDGCAYELPEAPWLQGIIVQTGVFDFLNLSEAPEMAADIEAKYLGASYDDDPDLWADASVQQHVTSDLPPHLLLTPEDFEPVPKSLSESYAAALDEVGVSATVVAFPDADFYSLLADPQATAAIQAFMDEL